MLRPAAAAEPTFALDVMAVLSKAGCNAGTCHGNQNGKGGFHLSLRGEDPAADYLAITRGEAGRRLDLIQPARSLLLLKPTGRVAHEGGVRFSRDSEPYRILLDWLNDGALPGDSSEPGVVALEVNPADGIVIAPSADVQLRVTARLSDGRARDVTTLAVYEPASGAVDVYATGRVARRAPGEAVVLVRFLGHQTAVRMAFLDAPPTPTPTATRPANFVDRWIDEKLQRLGIPASPPCDDATFVRRVYLDLLGILPEADEARSFCADARPDKRARLIDVLLARPEFTDHWALKWSDLLRNEEKVLDSTGVDVFHAWIRDSMRQGVPLNEFVHQLLSARGSTYRVPATNYYRANRDAVTRAETTARVFLGTRLQCARCHNHPFERWTQDDYYSWASCFEGIDYEIVKNDRRDKLDKHEFVGEQIVLMRSEGAVTHPRTGRPVAPRFLGSDTRLDFARRDRFLAIADWLASSDNPFFARVLSNLIWYHTMARGLVDPLDDFRVTNPPSHPELLEELAAELVRSGFDLRHLVRCLVNSQAYQRSADVLPPQPAEDTLYARAVVRRLSAEQLLDAQSQVLGEPAEFAGFARGTRAGQLPGVQRVRERDRQATAADRFLKTFGKPERLLGCECERSYETSLTQVFTLLGEPLQQRLASDHNRLARWAAGNRPAAPCLEELYWTALSRAPSAAELLACQDLLQAESDPRAAWQDVAWALLNSKEFLFRH